MQASGGDLAICEECTFKLYRSKQTSTAGASTFIQAKHNGMFKHAAACRHILQKLQASTSLQAAGHTCVRGMMTTAMMRIAWVCVSPWCAKICCKLSAQVRCRRAGAAKIATLTVQKARTLPLRPKAAAPKSSNDLAPGRSVPSRENMTPENATAAPIATSTARQPSAMRAWLCLVLPQAICGCTALSNCSTFFR